MTSLSSSFNGSGNLANALKKFQEWLKCPWAEDDMTEFGSDLNHEN